MRRSPGLLLSAVLVLAAGWVGLPPPAHAAVVTPVTGLLSAGNGIAVGSDGNLWVAEEFNGSVAKVSPSGAVLGRVAVGGNPTDVTSGPGGTVWVTVPDLSKVVRISVADSGHIDYPTAALAACGPVGVADGGDGFIYLSFPCSPTPKIGRVPANGGPGAGSVGGRGTVFDLTVTGGKLFAPDYDNDVVRQLNLSPTFDVVATVSAPPGSGPDGITSVGGRIYVTLFNSGGVAYFPANQMGGNTTSVSGVTGLGSPFGISPNGSGGVIVTGKSTSNYAYVDAAGTVGLTPLPAGSQPWVATTAPNGDVWITDQAKSQIYRVVDNAPTGSIAAPKARTSSTALVDLSVDPHGNDTSWKVQYGLNTAYGKTVTATLAGAAGLVARTATLGKLKAGKTYHLRLVATNQRGTFTGADVTFKMPALAKGKTAFKSSVSKAGTTLKSVKVTKLVKGESVTVTCGGGKGCPFKKKAFKNVRKASLDLSALSKGKVLKPGVTVTVTITAKKLAASTTALTVRAGSSPTVV